MQENDPIRVLIGHAVEIVGIPKYDGTVIAAGEQDVAVARHAGDGVLVADERAIIVEGIALSLVDVDLRGIAANDYKRAALVPKIVQAQYLVAFLVIECKVPPIVDMLIELRVNRRRDVLPIFSALFFLSDLPYRYLAIVTSGDKVLVVHRRLADDARYRIGVLESFLRFEDDGAADLKIPKSDGAVLLPCRDQAAILEEAHAARFALLKLQGRHDFHVLRVPQFDGAIEGAGDQFGFVLDRLVGLLTKSARVQCDYVQDRVGVAFDILRLLSQLDPVRSHASLREHKQRLPQVLFEDLDLFDLDSNFGRLFVEAAHLFRIFLFVSVIGEQMLLNCELRAQIDVGDVDVAQLVGKVEFLRLVIPADRGVQALVRVGHAEEVFPLFFRLRRWRLLHWELLRHIKACTISSYHLVEANRESAALFLAVQDLREAESMDAAFLVLEQELDLLILFFGPPPSIGRLELEQGAFGIASVYS